MLIFCLILSVLCTKVLAFNASTIKTIVEKISDCQIHSVHVENQYLKIHKNIMEDGFYSASNHKNGSVLTIRNDLSKVENISEYFSQFTLCESILVTSENILDILKFVEANISINAGIFSYDTDDFGNVTKLSEFYKTHELSDQVITHTIFDPSQGKNRIESVWNRRYNLHGATFTAISS